MKLNTISPEEAEFKSTNPSGWMKRLIFTKDLDPLYVALNEARRREVMDNDQIIRFCIAYWLTYSVGFSYRASCCKGLDFWELMSIHARNKSIPSEELDGVRDSKWRRGQERRHFRGQKAEDAVSKLCSRFHTPENLVRSIVNKNKGAPFSDWMGAFQELPQFGPWISFKAVDMMEAVFMHEDIEFPKDINILYKSPRKALSKLISFLKEENATLNEIEALQYLIMWAKGFVEPTGRRTCKFQEVETCLCKWGSKTYYIGKDTYEHKEELDLWGGDVLSSCYHVFSTDELLRDLAD